MPEKRARKHHILPKSYLKRFAQANDQIWVLDFEIKKQYQSSIYDAATIKDFYTVKTVHSHEDDLIEQRFLSDIEGKCNPAIDDIINNRTFSKDNTWDLLANYTGLMYTRIPLFRQKLLETYEQFYIKMNDELTENEKSYYEIMNELKKNNPDIEVLPFEEAKKAKDKLEISADIPRTFYVMQMMYYAANLVPIIYKMTPNLLYVPSGCEERFVTGDVPIIPAPRNLKASKMWIGDTNCDLYFPLSSRCCLVLNYDGLRKVNNVNRKGIAFINHLVACNCMRIVLSENQSFIWMRENGMISNDRQLLIDSCGPEKKANLRAKIPGVNISSSCRNDWNLLTSDDKD